MARWISEADVGELVAIPDANEVVELLLRAIAAQRAESQPRQRIQVPGAMLHGMIGGCEYLDRVGWKQYITSRGGAQFLVGLYDARAPRLLALIEANRLGQLRTGAISAQAVRAIHGGEMGRLALIGCGWQAESQLEAICDATTVHSITAYCRDAERREEFCQRMGRRVGREIIPAPDARSAVEGAEVVVCMTTSRTPVVQSEWLGGCRLLVAAGSNAENRTEFPPALLSTVARVVCDDIPSCRREAGELLAAARAGIFRFEDALPLADFFGPQAPPSARGLQIFKSVGMAAADVAMADRIHRRAVERGRGVELPGV